VVGFLRGEGGRGTSMGARWRRLSIAQELVLVDGATEAEVLSKADAGDFGKISRISPAEWAQYGAIWAGKLTHARSIFGRAGSFGEHIGRGNSSREHVKPSKLI
jgi:hypothetical protein